MASPAPPGITPNFVNPPSIGYQLVESSIITGSFALVAVAARWTTKIWVSRSVGWDDYFSLAAMVFAIGRIIGGCVMVYNYGTGRHAWDDPLDKALKTTSVEVAINALYLWAIMFAKLSLLALYVRLFGVNQAFKRTCYLMAGIIVFYCVACTPMYILGCVPSGARTFAQVDKGQCVKTIQLNIAVGAINIATDTALIVLPIPMLLGLQVSKRKRVALFTVFATGLVAWAASVVREVKFVNDVHVTDGTWTQVADVMWLTIEMNVGILAGCLPVLYPLGQRIGQYESIRSGLSSLNNQSRQLRKKLSLSWRSSGSEGRGSESLKDLKFDSEERGQIERSSLSDAENGMGMANAKGEEQWFVTQQGQAGTQRGRREGY